jgi:hypothetical protein
MDDQWKTFENTSTGVSIEYPNDWGYEEDASLVCIERGWLPRFLFFPFYRSLFEPCSIFRYFAVLEIRNHPF